MRILVIGGTKFIGFAAVKHLWGMGHEVTVFHRGDTESAELPDVPHLHGDRRRLADFSDDFKRLAPDVVLDTVAYTERDARTAMATLASVARRIVVLSSMDVYRAYGGVKGSESGPPDAVPLTEDAPLRVSLYPDAADVPEAKDYDNILVERAVMGDPALPATILRLPAVYGPHDYQHRLFYYLKRMDDHRPAILLDEGMARWRWTRGYVENVAAAIALAVVDERAAGRVYNVGEPDALPEARGCAPSVVWNAEDWRAVIPDDRLRQRMVAELRPRPLAFFQEPIPGFAHGPDAPCAYLQFSAPYARAAWHARRASWAYRELEAGHFHMLVDPAAVTNALLELLHL